MRMPFTPNGMFGLPARAGSANHTAGAPPPAGTLCGRPAHRDRASRCSRFRKNWRIPVNSRGLLIAARGTTASTVTPETVHMTQLLRAIAICLLLPVATAAQGLTGALIGTVKDVQGGVLPGAHVRLTSPALIGGPMTVISDEKGQLRFSTLPPGPYALDVELQGFAGYHEDDIRIGAGATIERTAVLSVAGLAESVVVEGAGSRIDARDPGFATRFGPEDLKTIPTRRSSMFDA